ncbi:hemolymph lipopolysaccharide-binding protein-like [Periplaneta americana]|uniref:hemolymph lipopolysaccharide-binding protein-like n=1 Tax=Periplaneta americana TaxID=6978 RepID=UPI0037E8EE86
MDTCQLLLCAVVYLTLFSNASSVDKTKFGCASMENSDFNLLMTSSRNRTGQWTAQIQLQHGTKEKVGSWEVDVDHSAEKCESGDVVTIVATVRGPRAPPASGYEFVPGFGYYKFYVTGKSWRDAEETCEQEGAHLVIANSMDEFVAIKKIWDRYPSPYTDWRKNHVYMGVTDIAKEGHFVSVLGQTLNATGYSVWGPNQPDGGAKEDCLLLTVNTQIHDVACHAAVSFICERELD